MKRRKRKVTLAHPSAPPSYSGEDSTGLSDEFHFTGSTPFLPFPTDDLRDVHRPAPPGTEKHRVPPVLYFDFLLPLSTIDKSRNFLESNLTSRFPKNRVF